MEPLRKLYEENGIPHPKNFLDREEWLYEKLTEDTALVVLGNELVNGELSEAKEEIENLKTKLANYYLKYWVGGAVLAATVMSFVIATTIMSGNDELHQLQAENAQLKNTAEWIKKADNLQKENAGLQAQLEAKRHGVWLDRLLFAGLGVGGSFILVLAIVLYSMNKR